MIWWRTCVSDILEENRIPELKAHIASWCQRGKMLVSMSWEKPNSVNRSLNMAQGRMCLMSPRHKQKGLKSEG